MDVLDLVIVGAGPAGITAAIYAKRASINFALYEKSFVGGNVVNAFEIENYPGYAKINGADLAMQFNSNLTELNIDVNYDEVTKISKENDIFSLETAYSGTLHAKKVLLALGTKSKKLGLPNEDQFMGRGISTCATCDGNFYKGKDVLVVGGGNTAIEDALYLANITKKVYLVHRRDTFRADFKSIQLLKEKKNVEFIYQSNVTKINGKDKLESVEITNNQGEKKVIKIDGLFIAIGQVPQNECFKNTIKVDDNGYVLAKENCHTNKKGIFVAGDVRRKSLRQLVTAISDGAVAATEAIKYLDNMQLTKK